MPNIKTPSISIEELNRLLHYEPSTGVLTWKVSRGGMPAGSVAGNKNNNGYLKISVQNRPLLGHRVAWALHYGEWPGKLIDHINRQTLDNRITNLRLADVAENNINRGKLENTTSKYLGVCWSKDKRKWLASITSNGRWIYLGKFAKEADAAKAFNEAARIHHGEFACFNKIEDPA